MTVLSCLVLYCRGHCHCNCNRLFLPCLCLVWSSCLVLSLLVLSRFSARKPRLSLLFSHNVALLSLAFALCLFSLPLSFVLPSFLPLSLSLLLPLSCAFACLCLFHFMPCHVFSRLVLQCLVYVYVYVYVYVVAVVVTVVVLVFPRLVLSLGPFLLHRLCITFFVFPLFTFVLFCLAFALT